MDLSHLERVSLGSFFQLPRFAFCLFTFHRQKGKKQKVDVSHRRNSAVLFSDLLFAVPSPCSSSRDYVVLFLFSKF